MFNIEIISEVFLDFCLCQQNHNLFVSKKQVQFTSEVETFEPTEEKDVNFVSDTGFRVILRDLNFGELWSMKRTAAEKTKPDSMF